MVSSAYCMIGNLLLGSASIGSEKIPWVWALLTMHWRRSAARTKSKGESGSPCLTPLLHWNCVPGMPFNRTEVVALSKNFLTQSIHVALKPIFSKIFRIVTCSIESKAFSKSNFKMINSLLDCWHWWIYSKAQAMQSCIVLFFMRPYWFLWISVEGASFVLLDAKHVVGASTLRSSVRLD